MEKTTKKCPRCGEIKDLSKYGIRRDRNNAAKSFCKMREKEAVIEYQKTKKGVVGVIYNSQKKHSRARSHRPPDYTKEELKEWLYSKTLFHELYSEWVNSGYRKKLKPSVDRKMDDVHYCFGNIQLMTWGENHKKDNAGRYKDKHGHRNTTRWPNMVQ